MNNKNNDAHLAAANDVASVEIEVEKCSAMRTKLYRVSDELAEQERSRRTISVYDYDDTKIITYSSPTELEMTRSMPNKDINDEDNRQYYTYEYIPSPQFHKLHHVFVTLKASEIQVAPEYADRVQIRMCDNLMHNVVNDAIISFPNKDGLTEGVYNHRVNTFFHDSYLDVDCLNTQKYDYDIGNRKSLTKWSTLLRTHDELFLPLKFFIDASEKYAIPIHMYNNPNNIKIIVTYCLAYESLLQMRVLNEKKEWEIIPPNFKFLKTADREFKAPKVWGIYRMLPKKELALEKEGYRILISDNKYLEDKEIKKDFDIDLTDERVIRHVRYGFLNYKATLFNNHSNYTLDHNNRKHGDDPQEDFALSYGNVPRITKRSNIHSTSVPNHYNYLSDSPQKGIHTLSFELFAYNIYPDPAIIMDKKSVLTGTLRNQRKRIGQKNENNKKNKNNDDNDDEIAKALGKKRKNFAPEEIDDSISEKFIFKGYCKVYKYLTFKVGTIVIEE